MKIKVKLFDPCCKIEFNHKGDWIDLHSRYTLEYKAPIADRLTKNKTVRKVNYEKLMIPLGVAMQLPKGYEAMIIPRSSSYKNYGFIQANSCGLIDYTYRGDNDEWMLPIIPMQDGKVNTGDRVCQFKIQLSQKANIWQRIKWLFTNKIEFEFVDSFNTESRGGFGTSGK